MHAFRILVVDDHQDCADSLRDILEIEGYRSRASYCGRDALLAARGWAPHAVIMDLHMPDVPGHELALALRTEIDPAIRMLAVTGLQDARLRERSFELGFDAHFLKPCDPRELLAMLANCCERRRLRA